jgi:outer membrane protein assembly factor BamE
MRIVLICLISFTLLAGGCSWIKFPGVHKVAIQQGNIVDQEMIDKLLPGMTKSQVRFVLGTPLVTDTFNQTRWDYFYSRKSPAGKETQEQVTIFFDQDDKLERMSGDYMPTPAAEPEAK